MTQRTYSQLTRGVDKPHLRLVNGKWLCIYFEPLEGNYGKWINTDGRSPHEAFCRFRLLRGALWINRNSRYGKFGSTPQLRS